MIDKYALTTAMKTSISEVLETMFFLPIDVLSGANGGIVQYEPEDVAVELDFNGPASGRFQMLVPGSLAHKIASDFLGIDLVKVTRDDINGTVKEMVNMLAGNTLSLYDSELVFDLGVPAMFYADDSGSDEVRECDQVCLEVRTLHSRMVITVTYKY
jgi:CheY-specific phosphatase CheX